MSDIASQFVLLPAVINDQSRTLLVVIGIAAFSAGLLLMMRHKRDIEEVYRSVADKRVRRFEQRKFRRRSLASSFIAAMGVLMISLYWARDPTAFISLLSVIVILLSAVLFLAILDLMSIGLHTATQDDGAARRKLVKEYLQQREKKIKTDNSRDSVD